MRWLSASLGGALVGITTVVYTISFFAIVFSGALAGHIEHWVGAILIAAAIMAAFGAVLFSYRGTVMHPQDITAALFSVAAVKVTAEMPGATETEVVATVLTMVAVTGAAAGLVAVAIGRARLSHMVHLVPHPVVLGFLAATGAALILGAIAIVTKQSLAVWDVPRILSADFLVQWGPWLLISALVYVLTRWIRSPLVLPLSLTVTLAGFHAVFGLGLAGDPARMAGMMLVTPGSGQTLNFAPAMYPLADWSAILRELPLLAAIVGLTVVGGLLNLSGVRQITRHRMSSDQDLRALGTANMASAAFGGLVGYPAVSTTFLGWRVGFRSWGAPVAAAAACAVTGVLGLDILSVIPTGLFATIVGYLGLDLLIGSARVAHDRLTRTDKALFAVVVGTALTLGFLEAIALGLVIAVLLFARDMIRVDIFHADAPVTVATPVLYRSDRDARTRTDTVPELAIIELRGYLFFGICARLLDLDKRYLDVEHGPPDIVLIDLSRVSGMDISAALILTDFLDACAERGVTPMLSGVSATVLGTLEKSANDRGGTLITYPTREAALARIGEGALRRGAGDTSHARGKAQTAERAYS